MAKKKQRKYKNRDVIRLAHKLGLPGNLPHKTIATRLIKEMGLDSHTPYWQALNLYFSNEFAFDGIKPYEKKKKGSTPIPKVAKPKFLKSFEWRRLRLQALKMYGPKCMCCGATPGSGAIMNVDHIKPRKTHPDLALEIKNLQILCNECNHGKGNWDTTDFRPR